MNNLFNKSMLFLKRNSPTILTAIGSAGVIATTVTAVKATPKALYLLENARVEKGENLTKLETVKVAAPVYIPSILIGASTIACIFGANALSKRQQASLMSAYALLNNSYKEYKNKVKDILGEEAALNIETEIAKDNYVEATPINERKELFYDAYSKRYFEATIYEIQEAEYKLNRDFITRDYAMLNEWYKYIGLEELSAYNDVGWSTGMVFDYYWENWIDFGHTTFTTDDGRECIMITLHSEPDVTWDSYF